MPTTRKRPAPGTSPLPSREQLAKDNRTASPEVPQTSTLEWQYPAPNMANSGSNQQYAPNISSFQNNGQIDQDAGSTAQQVARRPFDSVQSLVAPQYDEAAAQGQWTGNGEQTPTGDWPVQYDDLNQQAELAKRDAQSKRKQIPPFIQKLSR